MNVLICSDGVFNSIGGGQTFFLSLIKSNPSIRFFCFQHGLDPPANVPDNVKLLPVNDTYRRQTDRVDLSGQRLRGVSLEGKSNDILLLLDLAKAADGVSFDVVDIPDYMPFMSLFPEALRLLGVSFVKVSVSMHGTLSDGLTDNWAEVIDPRTRTLLEINEDCLYRLADIRYGISDAYLDEWEGRTGVRGHLIDLWTFFRLDEFAALRNAGKGMVDERAPDLVFAGRQEKWKGPDLFIDIAGNLPRDAYASARLVGTPVRLGGRNSEDELSAMAARRGLDITQQSLPRPQLLKAFCRENWFVVAPSRKDTFNFVALEALLCGAPCAISSKAGVARYLRESMPDVPFVQIDPSDTRGATALIRKALEDHAGIRARQGLALQRLEPIRRGQSYLDICGGQSRADANVRQEAGLAMGACFAAIEAADRPPVSGDAMTLMLPDEAPAIVAVGARKAGVDLSIVASGMPSAGRMAMSDGHRTAHHTLRDIGGSPFSFSKVSLTAPAFARGDAELVVTQSYEGERLAALCERSANGSTAGLVVPTAPGLAVELAIPSASVPGCVVIDVGLRQDGADDIAVDASLDGFPTALERVREPGGRIVHRVGVPPELLPPPMSHVRLNLTATPRDGGAAAIDLQDIVVRLVLGERGDGISGRSSTRNGKDGSSRSSLSPAALADRTATLLRQLLARASGVGALRSTDPDAAAPPSGTGSTAQRPVRLAKASPQLPLTLKARLNPPRAAGRRLLASINGRPAPFTLEDGDIKIEREGSLLDQSEDWSLAVEVSSALGGSVALTNRWAIFSHRIGLDENRLGGVVRITNLHKPEIHGPSSWHTWTGPSPTTEFSIPIALVGRCRLSIEVVNFGNNRSDSDFVLTVDGRETPVVVARMTERSGMLRADFDGDGGETPLTVIRLTARQLLSPWETGDSRTLAIAISSLKLSMELGG
jgi:glycosyltransferase involved in cell wall biosynthesis